MREIRGSRLADLVRNSLPQVTKTGKTRDCAQIRIHDERHVHFRFLGKDFVISSRGIVGEMPFGPHANFDTVTSDDTKTIDSLIKTYLGEVPAEKIAKASMEVVATEPVTT